MKKLIVLAVMLAFLASCSNSFEVYKSAGAIVGNSYQYSYIEDNVDERMKVSRYGNMADRVFSIAYHDKVLLIGEVDSEQITIMLSEEANKVNGVNKVYSDLRVTTESSMIGSVKRSSTDATIIAQIDILLASKLKLQKDWYRIAVFNGTIYILGITHNEQQIDILMNTLEIAYGTKEIYSYITDT